ncbi:MAG: carboxypeptidase-like regulatory domain-containing protein, partial [Actinomycetota bacterium]
NLTQFGPANTVTVTETSLASGYSLTAITCHSDVLNNNTINVQSRFVTILLEDTENVVCTFVNAVTTAASVSISGSITDELGQAVPRTSVTILNTTTGETQRASSNSFGKYRFDNLVVGDFYIITVANKKYVFSPDTQSFVLNDAVENLNFTATSP